MRHSDSLDPEPFRYSKNSGRYINFVQQSHHGDRLREDRELGTGLRLAEMAYLEYRLACRRWLRASRGWDLRRIEAARLEMARLARKASREYHEAGMMLKRIAYHATFED